MTMKPEIYCLKCRRFTPNKEVRTETITTKGSERKIQKTECVECGKKKNRFIKSERSFINNEPK